MGLKESKLAHGLEGKLTCSWACRWSYYVQFLTRLVRSEQVEMEFVG
jgi:hypothetical protein